MVSESMVKIEQWNFPLIIPTVEKGRCHRSKCDRGQHEDGEGGRRHRGEDEKETVGRESGGVESVRVQERVKQLKVSKDVWIVSRVGKLGVKFDPPVRIQNN